LSGANIYAPVLSNKFPEDELAEIMDTDAAAVEFP
jgi:hypothetical protein